MLHGDPRGDAVRQRYADLLLDESDNPALARLIRDLDGVANHPAPD